MHHVTKVLLLPLLLASSLAYGQMIYTAPYEGFPVTPTGNATLQETGQDLEIQNIGASGADGVRFDSGAFEAVGVRYAPFPASAPTGAERTTEWTHADGTVQCLRELKTPFGIFLSMDFGAAGPVPHRIELLRKGEVVAVQTGHVGAWDLFVHNDPGSSRVEGLGFADPGPGSTEAPINYGDFSGTSVMYLDVTETANMPDGTIAEFDEVVIRPDAATPASPIDFMTVYGRDTGPLTIIGASRSAGNGRLTGKGDVLFTPQPSGLFVGMEEQSTLWAGIRTVDMKNVERLQAEVSLPGPFVQIFSGASMSVRAGHAGSPTDLINVEVQSNGADADLSVVFDPAFPGTTTVEARSVGGLVASGPMPVAIVPHWSTWDDIYYDYHSSDSSLTVVLRLAQPTPIDLSGAGLGIVTADELRFERATQPGVPTFDRFEILARAVTGFMLEDLDVATAATIPPFRGTGEDFVLRSSVGGPLSGDPTKSVAVGAPLILHFWSVYGTFDLLPLLGLYQILAPGEMPMSPFPGIAVNPAGTVGLLVGDPAAPFGTLLLPPGGATLILTAPPILAGHRLLVQGAIATAAAANGIFTSTDGHMFTITP